MPFIAITLKSEYPPDGAVQLSFSEVLLLSHTIRLDTVPGSKEKMEGKYDTTSLGLLTMKPPSNFTNVRRGLDLLPLKFTLCVETSYQL